MLGRLLTFTLLALALALVACAGDGASPEALQQAVTNAEAAGTARVAFGAEMELGEQAGAGTLITEGEGQVDYANQISRMMFTFSGEGGQADQVAELMGDMEAIYESAVIYMKWPFLTQLMPEPTPWIRMDLDLLSEEFGLDMEQLMQFSQNNPTYGLEYLKGAEDADEVDSEDVRGVETTHYQTEVRLDDLGDDLPSELGRQLKRLNELLGVEKIPTDVWIDEEGLARRVSYEFEFDPSDDAPPGSPTGTMIMEMEFFDFGSEVEIHTPPQSAVTDLADLVGGEAP
jgi:hypothetical protein